MASLERRTSERVNVAFEITYECFSANGKKVDTGSAYTVNISGRGVLVELPRNVEADARMLLCIKKPFYTMLVMGNVVHSHQVQDGAYQIGMQMTDMIEGRWQDWEKLVQPNWEEPQHEGF